jgi:hypothetical protein
MNGKLRLLPLTPRRPTCWTGGGERRSLGRHTGKATCCVKASGVQGASICVASSALPRGPLPRCPRQRTKAGAVQAEWLGTPPEW